MAEVLSEQWLIVGYVVHVFNDNLSSSPLALIFASSWIFSLNTSVDDTNILGHESWSAVVVIWDQVSSVVPNADIDVAIAFLFLFLSEAH
jgi:hypothetical protein